jgi:hypothetical protein
VIDLDGKRIDKVLASPQLHPVRASVLAQDND